MVFILCLIFTLLLLYFLVCLFLPFLTFHFLHFSALFLPFHYSPRSSLDFVTHSLPISYSFYLLFFLTCDFSLLPFLHLAFSPSSFSLPLPLFIGLRNLLSAFSTLLFYFSFNCDCFVPILYSSLASNPLLFLPLRSIL